MFIKPEGSLVKFLIEAKMEELLGGFALTQEQQERVKKRRAEADETLPEATEEEKQAWAIYTVLSHPGHRGHENVPDVEPPDGEAASEVATAVSHVRSSALKMARAAQGVEAAVSPLPDAMGKVRAIAETAISVAEQSRQMVESITDSIRQTTLAFSRTLAESTEQSKVAAEQSKQVLAVATEESKKLVEEVSSSARQTSSRHIRAVSDMMEQTESTINSVRRVVAKMKELVDESEKVILSFPEGPVTVIRTPGRIGPVLTWVWRAVVVGLLAALLLVPSARGQETVVFDDGTMENPYAPPPLKQEDRETLKDLQIQAYEKLLQIKDKYAEAKDAAIASEKAKVDALKLEFELSSINSKISVFHGKLIRNYSAIGYTLSKDFEWVKKKETTP